MESPVQLSHTQAAFTQGASRLASMRDTTGHTPLKLRPETQGVTLVVR